MTTVPMTTLDQRQCRAHNRFGESCRQRPIRGGVVCVAHGGRAPQVKRAAAQRIADLVDPALDVLAQLLEHADSDATRLAAVKLILDYAGLKPTERVEASGKLVIEIVYGDVPGELDGPVQPAPRAHVMDSGVELGVVATSWDPKTRVMGSG